MPVELALCGRSEKVLRMEGTAKTKTAPKIDPQTLATPPMRMAAISWMESSKFQVEGVAMP